MAAAARVAASRMRLRVVKRGAVLDRKWGSGAETRAEFFARRAQIEIDNDNDNQIFFRACMRACVRACVFASVRFCVRAFVHF